MSTSGIIKNVKICLRLNSKRRLPKVGQQDLSLNIYTRCCTWEWKLYDVKKTA